MSDYIKSTNFAAKDSLVTGNPSKVVKGTELDTEFNNIAAASASKADIASPTFTGTPSGPTASAGSNTSQLATTSFVQTALSAAFTSGMIMLWSGASTAIPSGWYLCNGSNGTPNLTDKFVVGAGNTYAVGATGGTADAVVVAHTHTATVTDPGHSHGYDRAGNALPQTGSSTQCLTNPAATHPQTDTSTTGISVTNSSTGVSGTGMNLPPYYALCYIMKA